MMDMTEKRFTYDAPDGSDIWDNGHYLALANNPKEAKKIVECLNNLHEENIALRNDDTITDYEVQISKLITEKQRLTDTCNSLAETINRKDRRIQSLEEHLENLKKEYKFE